MPDLTETLERFVDAHGLATVLLALTDICLKKAAGRQKNPDKGPWNRAAGLCNAASVKVGGLELP